MNPSAVERDQDLLPDASVRGGLFSSVDLSPASRYHCLCMAKVAFVLFLPVLSVAGEAFVRGDVNGDGIVGLADLLYLESCLQGGDSPSAVLPIPDAADVDDNGIIDPRDAAALIKNLFCCKRPRIAKPFPLPGPDPIKFFLPELSLKLVVCLYHLALVHLKDGYDKE